MQYNNDYPEIRLFCDFDHTLIYSHRVVLEGDKIAVEYLDRKEQSFMTRKTYEFLYKQNHYEFIPVTTRSKEQFDRITIFHKKALCKYALICNGGVLLVDGIEDGTWYEETMSQGLWPDRES